MFFVLVLLCGSLRAQGEAVLEKILVVYSAGGSHNSVWIPYEAGIFRKNGLDVEGIHYAKTHREFSVAILGKYLKNEDQQLLNVLYDLYVLRYVPKIPYPTAEPFKTVLAQIAETDAKAASAKPESFIEPRFIQDLEREGLMQRLWQ